MRCPECASQRTRVHRGTGTPSGFAAAPATYVLIALNVAAFLIEIASGGGGFTTGPANSVVADFGLQRLAVADGEVYRLLTGGFLHASLIHIGFNMYLLYLFGRVLEQGIGTPRFLAVYFASLFAGSLGAILLSGLLEITVGASGAVFGVFGATYLIAKERGHHQLASEVGILLLINLALTFVINNISVGGHLGGLAGGAICGLVVIAGDRGMLGRSRVAVEIAAMAGLAVVAFAAAVVLA